MEAVAQGAEEYYTGAKEAPGQWLGRGAEQLGLDGEVDADELGRVLEHLHPDGTHKLTAARSVPVVAGFDATFCAPKSVSLLYALGEPEVSNQVRNAADAAIAASFDVLERAACRVRRGQGGHTVLDGDGFVAAAFRHRTLAGGRSASAYARGHRQPRVRRGGSDSGRRWMVDRCIRGCRRSGICTRRSCGGS